MHTKLFIYSMCNVCTSHTHKWKNVFTCELRICYSFVLPCSPIVFKAETNKSQLLFKKREIAIIHLETHFISLYNALQQNSLKCYCFQKLFFLVSSKIDWTIDNANFIFFFSEIQTWIKIGFMKSFYFDYFDFLSKILHFLHSRYYPWRRIYNIKL